MATPSPEPLISIIIVNYNGKFWIDRCLESLRQQTIFEQLEIIITDNQSTDGSDLVAQAQLERLGRGTFVQNGANLGFCEGNNIGAKLSTGKYLLFLNADTWLEPGCLASLCADVESWPADAGVPAVLNYDDDTFQGSAAAGLDIFGMTNTMQKVANTTEVFAASGCSLLVRRTLFERIGGFPPELFMYAEETDLAWRIWIAGGRIIVVPAARLHHRGATTANPKGDTQITEFRTNESKRFLSNRNSILLLLKNSQHVLLLLLIPHLLLLLTEAIFSLFLIRRWAFVRKCYIEAVADCWRLRGHVGVWRRRIRVFRRRSDFWMLRFVHWRPNRWIEIKRLLKFGIPKVDQR